MKSTLVKYEITPQAPVWAHKVDRWHQLDEVSFAFCEALSRWNDLKEEPKPDLILLALEGASNVADSDFVRSGARSPAKFVYTLPNICMAVIFQFLNLKSRVFCLSRGKDTPAFAREEARFFAQAGKTVWVFSSSPLLEQGSRRVNFECFRP
ncbi:MAG TPA: hypothetical protein PL182_05975 [Pseudobdellovibrionaceae bacterium]|nr:hypothetical protein [Pseudobdellovibrionaceae bacterium]